MRITFDLLTALRALRVFRATGRPLPTERTTMPAPDPSPQSRWTARLIPRTRLALGAPGEDDAPLDVAVPSPAQRVEASIFSCSVRSRVAGRELFVDLGEGVFIPCPELLFYELADVMTPEAHALLAYELCGTYARDAADPRLGETTYGVPPVTSVARLSAFIEAQSRASRITMKARLNLRRAADNAWSPMEAVVALMLRLPVHELGYEFGEVTLNRRHEATPELVRAGARGSRVPDIAVVGTHVGFNYDGSGHLDLESVAEAALRGEERDAIRKVREKHRDDIRRTRELAAQGCVVFPLTAADLYAPGALDVVMLEAAMTMGELDGRSLGEMRVALMPGRLADTRQQLIWSLLPWPSGRRYARELLHRSPWGATSL